MKCGQECGHVDLFVKTMIVQNNLLRISTKIGQNNFFKLMTKTLVGSSQIELNQINNKILQSQIKKNENS